MSLGNTSVTESALYDSLRQFGQTHLLQYWDELSSSEQLRFEQQLREVDFALMRRLFEHGGSSESPVELAARAVAPPAFRLHATNSIDAAEARIEGAKALRAGRVGTVLVAGGQGTRLGFDHPKGMFPVGPVSNATLFQILFEKVLAVGERYGVRLPIYLMTSPATHRETIDFLAAHERFGLASEDVFVFCQGTMPAVDQHTGRLLLSGKGELFTSPNGHGGMLAALDRSGALDDIHHRGIEHLFYFQVDNPLVRVADETFLGYHLLSGSELSTQVVSKQAPLDKVGNVVSVDGQVRVIEYSDLPTTAAERRRDDGSLELWAGNIAVHLFDVPFLDRMRNDEQRLPFHIAHKAVPHLNEQGERVEPASPNAIKYERFIFDLLPAAQRPIVVEVDPATTFAPVKNATGADRDTPESVREQILTLHRSWLAEVGAIVDPGVAVEISPRYAVDVDALRQRWKSALHFQRPTYLTPDE